MMRLNARFGDQSLCANKAKKAIIFCLFTSNSVDARAILHFIKHSIVLVIRPAVLVIHTYIRKCVQLLLLNHNIMIMCLHISFFTVYTVAAF